MNEVAQSRVLAAIDKRGVVVGRDVHTGDVWFRVGNLVYRVMYLKRAGGRVVRRPVFVGTCQNVLNYHSVLREGIKINTRLLEDDHAEDI